MQGRYAKMALGVARNTPMYIWRVELGLESIEYTCRKRAIKYWEDILAMKEGRWPKACLMEEMRCIINNRPTKWGCKVIERLEEMEAVEVCRWIWEGGKEEVVIMKLKEDLDNWWKQKLEKEW
ncbi:GSCOCG00008685001-RA-CDS [Cotesia congregata]|uniref:Uncharacterized protein n=1 Tax=Cotesia congregata TaxID=51543 RepID=A0A8J2MK15_COTCN|nr:GSCOCG00008685001-RA-CDS [Cotesia congregata]CAG5096527.1 Protein of unknown function [Cotesia congregata]